MIDQANTLRRIFNPAQRRIMPIFGDLTQAMTSVLAGCLMDQAASIGQSCMTIDGSPNGLAVQWGVDVRHELLDHLTGRQRLEQVCIPGAGQNWLLPAARGVEHWRQEPSSLRRFLCHLGHTSFAPDLILLTLPMDAMALAGGLDTTDCERWIWVASPTARSVTAVYNGLRWAANHRPAVEHGLVVSGAHAAEQADHVFANMADAAGRFLTAPLEYAGFLPVKSLAGLKGLSDRLGLQGLASANTLHFKNAGSRIAKSVMTRLTTQQAS
jgi:MinD-like ATPase involved in chromosome partitioning or flagellar assembly